MKGIERLEEHKNDEFDKIIMDIRSGAIHCGKYSGLVKIKKDYDTKRNEYFKDRN